MDFVRLFKDEWRDWRRHPDFSGRKNKHQWQKQRNEQKKFYAGMSPEMRMANHD